MSQSDIDRAKAQAAAYERMQEQLRWLVEQKQLRAADAEAEAKLRAAEVKDEKPSPPQSAEGGPKTKLIRAAASAIWGPNGPPKNLPPQNTFQQVAAKLKPLHVSVSKSQVLRALGLKSG